MKKLLFAIVGAYLFSFLYACEADSSIPLEEIIRFNNPAEESLSANGYSQLPIAVVIPADAAADRRTVKFTTDLGLFSNDSASIYVVAENGIAATQLHGSRAGRAKLTAAIMGYAVNKTVLFTAVEGSDILAFVDLPASPLPADNLSEHALQLRIDPRSPASTRKLTLTTDLGSFSNQQTTIEVQANAEGLAQTYLKSDKAGRAIIRVTRGDFLLEDSVYFTAPDPEQLIRFTPGSFPAGVADGATAIEIKAQINNKMPAGRRKVSFRTDGGSFAAGSTVNSVEIEPDASGLARVLLRSRQEGFSTVTVEHNGINRSAEVEFKKAMPDQLSVETPFTIQAGIASQVTVTAQLSRQTGLPSSGFEILYTAFTKDGAAIGLFKTQKASGADGKATVLYSAGNTTYRGPVTITATLKGNTAITASTLLTVVDAEE
ncbi:MAG: hypothetical protein P0Y53_19125 [Candidatus Pseudobacter hemicellulosilyticus]|uniref:Big-1 domain-containing protein n=1 Tax=Candidatus Pseudobacter hemicellulosilyticus TaxID=3121375 RepID=A0AAJ5WR75_9BACT|nr:MAG: hypothetical protein P0Y53_19125 [Pseudobacter sp.]